jgi:hypothetical protein
VATLACTAVAPPTSPLDADGARARRESLTLGEGFNTLCQAEITHEITLSGIIAYCPVLVMVFR